MSTLVIADYGMGNMGSIQNMFRRIGVRAEVTGDRGAISQADKVVLPGVGAFDSAMQCINGSGLREVLDHKACEDRVPMLGICLGMQLLTRGSEEGVIPGLGWISAETRRFPSTRELKVPHMGWNVARPTRSSVLTQDLSEGSRFYFVHSYYVKVDHPEDSILESHYGVDFDSGIEHGNICGFQFHPEKSHRFGMQILKNFVDA